MKTLPASDFYVSLYLIHLSKTFHSAAKVHEAIYAISWAHNLAGLPDPCQSQLLKSVKDGALKMTSKPVVKKDPITPDILQNLVLKYGQATSNLYDLRITCMCLLAYSGFLRFSELVNIRRSHISFQNDNFSLFIPRSKTDVLNKGSTLVIAKSGKSTCPFAMLQMYLKAANILESDDQYIFRSLSFCKKSSNYKLRGSRPLSYTRAREILLSALSELGLDKSRFGLHSLRSGGATTAANSGVSDRLFKKHGRWVSENAEDGYVHENLVEKLSVSKNLGI